MSNSTIRRRRNRGAAASGHTRSLGGWGTGDRCAVGEGYGTISHLRTLGTQRQAWVRWDTWRGPSYADDWIPLAALRHQCVARRLPGRSLRDVFALHTDRSGRRYIVIGGDRQYQ